MMCTKDDVVMWFKELESYRRIDTMCTLLNMCLPFELRFLGTCLEELGRRDSQELRGIELRVNNPAELAVDVSACRLGEPTDMKIRRKMAMYLALIRACSRSCVAELFQTLDGWGERDFDKFCDGDPLQELLLVYTMASNHPVFTFEQRWRCGKIYTRISECCNNGAGTRTPLLTSFSTCLAAVAARDETTAGLAATKPTQEHPWSDAGGVVEQQPMLSLPEAVQQRPAGQRDLLGSVAAAAPTPGPGQQVSKSSLSFSLGIA